MNCWQTGSFRPPDRRSPHLSLAAVVPTLMDVVSSEDRQRRGLESDGNGTDLPGLVRQACDATIDAASRPCPLQAEGVASAKASVAETMQQNHEGRPQRLPSGDITYKGTRERVSRGAWGKHVDEK